MTASIVKGNIVNGNHNKVTVTCKTVCSITKSHTIFDDMWDMDAFAAKLKAVFVTVAYVSSLRTPLDLHK